MFRNSSDVRYADKGHEICICEISSTTLFCSARPFGPDNTDRLVLVVLFLSIHNVFSLLESVLKQYTCVTFATFFQKFRIL
jgi:hypothetical protein